MLNLNGKNKELVKRGELIAAAAALAVIAVFVASWAIEGAVHSRPIQVVPDLKGRSLTGALDMLAPLKIALVKEGAEFNASVPIGAVVRQLPAAGTRVREGKTIKVVLSQGGETVFAPALIGLPLRNAEMLLRQNQLILGEVAEASSLRLEKGLILSQDPQAESSVERSSLVNVVVSRGEPPEGVVLAPDFLRKNVAEASRWGNSMGVPLKIDKDASSLFPYGTVLAQDPQPDSLVSEGGGIRLTISGRAGSEKGKSSEKEFQYKVPQGSGESLVRVVVVDQQGERELFNGLRPPGSKVDLSIPEGGQSRIRIFLNGVLVEEKDL